MYVCLCQAVRESEVREAIASGARDVEALAEALGVCMGCGVCREAVEALIDQVAAPAAPATQAALGEAA